MIFETGLVDHSIKDRIRNCLACESMQTSYAFQEYKFISKDKHVDHYLSEFPDTCNGIDNYILVISPSKIEAWLTYRYLDFDSTLLGLPVVTVTSLVTHNESGNYTSLIFDALIDTLRKQKIEYATLSVSTNDLRSKEIINTAAKHNFRYLNTLLTFVPTRNTAIFLDNLTTPSNSIRIRESIEDDYDSLYNIAKNSFRLDRYHQDPLLDHERCDKLQARSFKNAFTDGYVDEVLTAEYEGKAIGFCTIKRKMIQNLGIRVGYPVIAAVSSDHRGMGVYQMLESERLRRLICSCDVSEFGTYINNHPVHSFLTKAQMKLLRGMVQMALHL